MARGVLASAAERRRDRIEMLHAPAALRCGASGVDIAGAACATDFCAATTTVFNAGDHLGVRTQPYRPDQVGRDRMVPLATDARCISRADVRRRSMHGLQRLELDREARAF
jgi:hypothetical protein